MLPSVMIPRYIPLISLCMLVVSVSASPSGSILLARASPENTVLVDGTDKYCMIVPKNPNTDVGDSETPGGTTTYCSPNAKYAPEQGEFASNFWANVEYMSGAGGNGTRNRYAQLTGCINPMTLDRLNSGDEGGQYDSSGGSKGIGNPEGSVCVGYNHYVELIEPVVSRACIRCCDDPLDCATTRDKKGCPAVVPGDYFGCI